MMLIITIGALLFAFIIGFILGGRFFTNYHNEDIEQLIQMNRCLEEELARVKSNV